MSQIKTFGLRVEILVQVGKVHSWNLYAALIGNEAVALFLLLMLLAHVIHPSLTVDTPYSLYLNQKTKSFKK